MNSELKFVNFNSDIFLQTFLGTSDFKYFLMEEFLKNSIYGMTNIMGISETLKLGLLN